MAKRSSAQDRKAALEAAAWFYENSTDVFVVVRDGRAERISPGWSNFLGWSEADTTSRSFWDFVHPDDIQSVRESLNRLQREGAVTYEHRILARSGEYHWAQVRLKLAASGAGVMVIRDISAERHRAEEAAQIASAHRLLGTAAGVHLWRFDPVSGCYEFSPDFTRPLEEAPANRRSPIGRAMSRIDPADRPAVEAAWDLTSRTGELAVVEYRVLGDEGDWRRRRSAWVGGRRLPSGVYMMVGVTQDLTELVSERDRARRGEEAAMAADRAKAEFLANISHEFRTPMNGVMGALHLLQRNPERADGPRLVEAALASGASLSQLLSDIVAFAEAEGEAAPVLALEPVTAGALVETVAGLHREAAAAKGLWLATDWQVGSPVRLDAAKVRQILGVLIGNAVKFTDAGGIEVAVASEGAGADHALVVSVRDTGVGVAESEHSRLFDRFHQADGSSTRQFGGAGLGLARALQLAKQMGGRIDCESELGAGSTFRLTLPAPACEAQPPLFEAAAQEGLLDGMQVLVVDDNPTNHLVARELLVSLGAEVTMAMDGAEGVATAVLGFDLILMDIQMPVMDGIEAARRIRCMAGPVGRTPIIALTANVSPKQRQAYADIGMNGCIAKPITPGALMLELGALLTPAAEEQAA